MRILYAKMYLNGIVENNKDNPEMQNVIGQIKRHLKSWRIDMDSNYDVIQGDCPSCPFADLFGGFCFYYRFYPANIGYGEATCRCEELKSRED